MRLFQGLKNCKINIVPVQTKNNIGKGRLNLKLGDIIYVTIIEDMYCFIYYSSSCVDVVKCLAGIKLTVLI